MTERGGTRAGAKRRQDLINRSLPICWLCDQPIDTTLPGTHPQGAHRHHKQPIVLGGTDTQANEALVHARCNLTAGDLPAEHSQAFVKQRLGLTTTPQPQTRDWGIG